MFTGEIKVGVVYASAKQGLKRVLRVDVESAVVEYQLITIDKCGPSERYRELPRLSEAPTDVEFQKRERVTYGINVGTQSVAEFRAWAAAEFEHPLKLIAPGKSMARLFLERMAQKQYLAVAFERAATADAVRKDFNITFHSFPWLFVFSDGSRVAFSAPGAFCEVDSIGKPLLSSYHCLDSRVIYNDKNTKKLVQQELSQCAHYLSFV